MENCHFSDSTYVFQSGILLISRYSNYENDENGAYDLSIVSVETNFIRRLERKVVCGEYTKYEMIADDLVLCTKAAWEKVWSETKSGRLKRAFTVDYESSVSAEFTKDGKAHCTLWIAQQQ